MIIRPVTITSHHQEIIVAAALAGPPLFDAMPRSVWFSFPAAYRDFVDDRADGAVVSLFLAAMSYGQDMIVEGVLSEHLYHGLNELQNILVRLFPQQVKRITIQAPNLCSSAPQSAPSAVASAFSGGVDSFYTLWQNLPLNALDPQTHVDYGLFVRGLDMYDATNYGLCQTVYTKMFVSLGLDLLSAHTNAREWYKKLDWSWQYISPLVGTALVLRRLLRRFYVPASSTADEPPPWGEFTYINRFFSTETLEVVDHGPIHRVDKIFAIASWHPTYDSLRVCYIHVDGVKNCSRCGKCVDTMIGLELAGHLARYTTFALPLTSQRIRLMRLGRNAIAFHRDTLDKAIALGRGWLVFNILIAFGLTYSLWGLAALGRWLGLHSPRRID